MDVLFGVFAGQFPGNGIAFVSVGMAFLFLQPADHFAFFVIAFLAVGVARFFGQIAGQRFRFGIAGVRVLMNRRIFHAADIFPVLVLAVLIVNMVILARDVTADQLALIIAAGILVIMLLEYLGERSFGDHGGRGLVLAAR